MPTRRTSLVLTAAAAAALSLGAAAEARNHGALHEKVHARATLAPSGAASLHVARLDVSRQNLQNQAIRLQITGAPKGQALLVFIADADGTMHPVGSMRVQGRSGRAAWNVRTARGDALPFGVPDVAFLSGRRIEVRSDAGVTLLEGVLPTATKATGISRKMKTLKQGLAVDPNASGVAAQVEFHRGEHGRPDRFAIRVEGEPTGLALEAWLQGTDGTFVKLGDLVENANQGEGDNNDQAGDGGDGGGDANGQSGDQGDDGDSGSGTPTGSTAGLRHGHAKAATVPTSGDTTGENDSTDNESGDGADDDTGGTTTTTSEYEFDLDASAALPFGATSLADLKGLSLEIRLASDQSVLASGILPDTSAPGDESDNSNGNQSSDSNGDDQGGAAGGDVGGGGEND
jgi:hypothetical protein